LKKYDLTKPNGWPELLGTCLVAIVWVIVVVFFVVAPLWFAVWGVLDCYNHGPSWLNILGIMVGLSCVLGGRVVVRK